MGDTWRLLEHSFYFLIVYVGEIQGILIVSETSTSSSVCLLGYIGYAISVWEEFSEEIRCCLGLALYILEAYRMIKKEKDFYKTGRANDWKGFADVNRLRKNLGGKEYLMARVDKRWT